jgi:membrane protease YdiL (CAAX protease family)
VNHDTPDAGAATTPAVDAALAARAAALRGEPLPGATAVDAALTAHGEPATRTGDEGAMDEDAAEDADSDRTDGGERRSGRRGPRQRREWRTGGTTVRDWNWLLVGWSVLALGAAVLAATASTEFIGGVAGGWIGTVAVWVALLLPVVFAYRLSVPRGLMRFRPVDLLFGLVLGVLLRFVSGALAEAATGRSAWPTYMTADGALPGTWWFDELVVPVVIGPVLEEFFFHGFLLVVLYTVFRRLTGVRAVSGVGALLVTTGLFVLLHQLTGSLVATWDGAVSVGLVGLVGGLLVLLTGRLWPAILLHVAFNGSYVVLALVGTLVGVGTGTGAGLA